MFKFFENHAATRKIMHCGHVSNKRCAVAVFTPQFVNNSISTLETLSKLNAKILLINVALNPCLKRIYDVAVRGAPPIDEIEISLRG